MSEPIHNALITSTDEVIRCVSRAEYLADIGIKSCDDDKTTPAFLRFEVDVRRVSVHSEEDLVAILEKRIVDDEQWLLRHQGAGNFFVAKHEREAVAIRAGHSRDAIAMVRRLSEQFREAALK